MLSLHAKKLERKKCFLAASCTKLKYEIREFIFKEKDKKNSAGIRGKVSYTVYVGPRAHNETSSENECRNISMCNFWYLHVGTYK